MNLSVYLGKLMYNKFIHKNNIMREPNRYEFAIKRGRTIDFLLGKREFLYEDDMFSQELHDPTLTFMDIEDYGKKHGEIKMLKQFKADIKKALQLNLSPFEFFYISSYIHMYIRYFYEKKSFTIEWIPDEETKTLSKKYYDAFLNQYDPLEEFNYKFPEQSNGFFLRNIMANYKYLKEHFGIDLLA
jgi:hypothetical protein